MMSGRRDAVKSAVTVNPKGVWTTRMRCRRKSEMARKKSRSSRASFCLDLPYSVRPRSFHVKTGHNPASGLTNIPHKHPPEYQIVRGVLARRGTEPRHQDASEPSSPAPASLISSHPSLSPESLLLPPPAPAAMHCPDAIRVCMQRPPLINYPQLPRPAPSAALSNRE